MIRFDPSFNQLILWPVQCCIFERKTQVHHIFWKGARCAPSLLWLNLYQLTLEFSESVEKFDRYYNLTSILASSSQWYYKACLEVFPLADLAEILCEWIKFDFAKILFQPRGCMTSLEIRGRLRSLEAARGRGHFWHPEARGSRLSTIYGGLRGFKMILASGSL